MTSRNMLTQSEIQAIFADGRKHAGIDLSGKILPAMEFANYLPSVNTMVTHCDQAIFTGPADFKHTVFLYNVYFISATFEGHADFENVKFDKEAYFLRANFKKGASFKEANLYGGGDFYSAHLENADFEDATLGHLDSSQEICFSEAYLEGARFKNAQIVKASFKNTHLQNADFEGVHFKDVVFDGADMSGANFKGAGFENVTFSNVNIDGIKWDGNTQLGNIKLKNVRGASPEFREAQARLCPLYADQAAEPVIHNPHKGDGPVNVIYGQLDPDFRARLTATAVTANQHVRGK